LQQSKSELGKEEDMEQNLSWKKAYLASALLHVVIVVLFVIGLAEIVKEKEQQTYIVDLSTSTFSQGSGHEGGGGGAFPEPLKEEEVAKRVETVQQIVPPKPIETPKPIEQIEPIESIEPIEPAPIKTPDVNPYPNPSTPISASSNAPAVSSAAAIGDSVGIGSGGSNGVGTGSGTGVGESGVGDGEGYGEGSGVGQGSGDGDISGTGTEDFDAEGFRVAIDANKQYPYMAIKRGLEGTVSVICMIDTSGSLVSVLLESSSGSDILDDAALDAVRSVGSFPNPTGKTVTVSTPVNFYLN